MIRRLVAKMLLGLLDDDLRWFIVRTVVNDVRYGGDLRFELGLHFKQLQKDK